MSVCEWLDWSFGQTAEEEERWKFAENGLLGFRFLGKKVARHVE